jgi:hypothetical protein
MGNKNEKEQCKFWESVKNSWVKFNEWLNNKFLLSKWPYVIVTILLTLLFVYCFNWDGLGEFGEFFGGFVGTIFTLISLLLVIRTFEYQRKESKDQRNDAAIQRFDDMFFELLRVYQEQVKELCIKGEDGKEYCGKEFFAKGIEKMKQEFDKNCPKSNNSYKNSAKKAYMTFYENNKSKLGAYFRTLFRIFDLIDNSILDTKQRKEYAKIIRAQLSENELFFIRYNAMTIYSSDENKEYINKYNLLKHLPIFELVEFEKECKNINITKKENSESINAIYYDIRKTLKDILKKYNSNQYTLGTSKSIELSKFNKKHKLYITLEKEYKIKFTYTMDKNIKTTTHSNFIFLDEMKQPTKTILLKLFINEIFFDSNFSEFNKRFRVKIEENSNNNENQIIITIENKKGQPLRLKKV